jgi:thiol-disulfide isomerase/thioredoxin
MKKIIFGYTENCGTCKMADQMLTIASHGKEVEIERVNLSISKEIISKYKITSTPAFILLDGDNVVDQFYAFHDVLYLHEKINNLLQNNV